MNLFGKFAGKKTYITAVIALLTALGAYLTGDLKGSEALLAGLGALGLGGLRHGVTTAVQNLKTPPVLMLMLLPAMLLGLSGCEAGKPSVSVDLFDGVCVMNAERTHTVCYNPLTKTATVRDTSTGIARAMTYDVATKTFRQTMPDGSTAVYKDGKLTVEPPLPALAAAPVAVPVDRGSGK